LRGEQCTARINGYEISAVGDGGGGVELGQMTSYFSQWGGEPERPSDRTREDIADFLMPGNCFHFARGTVVPERVARASR
jgi:hypothetical protein